MPRFRVGCAGWSIMSRHAAAFGEGEGHLARYATRFDVVEINSSFYRPHARATYARWAASVPSRFRFSVKVPKAITHEARLQGCGAALDRFAAEVAGLGRNLGGLLVQMPPSLVFDPRVANTFFAMLRRRFDSAVACEPRHVSWFDSKADVVWQRHAISRVAADPARLPGAALPAGDLRWQYWRWHGSPRMYYDSYDEDQLGFLAMAMKANAASRGVTWCIFDNTAAGHAIPNALRMQELLAESGKAQSPRKAPQPR